MLWVSFARSSAAKSTLIVAIAAALVSLAVEAFAHAEIESCKPPIDATMESLPDAVVCTTSESMDAKQSSLRVYDSAGARVDKGDSRVDPKDRDRRTISVSLDASKMRDGVYTVKWKTLSADDGDEAHGEFKLTVRR
ncbi:MAG TPA: copper resistance protein CopC [Burkholderiales bacterium]|nr:copper resistance protein CopC [Burkholderiales bacterium]